MNARARHPAGRGIIPPGPPHDDTISADSPVRLGPACCCPANPVVRVIMPAAATRAGATELLLCGHHYRASRQAPADANATVTELLGPAGTPPEALLPGLPSPRVPVS